MATVVVLPVPGPPQICHSGRTKRGGGRLGLASPRERAGEKAREMRRHPLRVESGRGAAWASARRRRSKAAARLGSSATGKAAPWPSSTSGVGALGRSAEPSLGARHQRRVGSARRAGSAAGGKGQETVPPPARKPAPAGSPSGRQAWPWARQKPQSPARHAHHLGHRRRQVSGPPRRPSAWPAGRRSARGKARARPAARRSSARPRSGVEGPLVLGSAKDANCPSCSFAKRVPRSSPREGGDPVSIQIRGGGLGTEPRLAGVTIGATVPCTTRSGPRVITRIPSTCVIASSSAATRARLGRAA